MYNTQITRRELLQVGSGCVANLALTIAQKNPVHAQGTDTQIGAIRFQFPVLNQNVNGRSLIYFDTAATAQRPTVVIEAIANFYRHRNANPAPHLHSLAQQSFEAYEGARRAVAKFIHASDPLEIVWTRGTTEAINLVAATWGEANIHSGDEIVLTIAEHASNMLPWQLLARRKEAKVRYVDVLESGRIDLDSLRRSLSERTKLVCFSQVSNVLGVVNPAAEICPMAHAAGAKVLIDAAQSAPHIPVDVQQLDCDFLVFSGHKVMGPMGIGVLWTKRSTLDSMPPYQAGSNMAHGGPEEWEYSEGARKFSAGTPNVSGAVGLAAAIEFISSIGFSELWKHEQLLTAQMHEVLSAQRGVRVLGSEETKNRISLLSFSVESMDVEELARKLDTQGIAIRAGDLAAFPLLQRFELKRAARASLYVYNTSEEIDRFAHALATILERA